MQHLLSLVTISVLILFATIPATAQLGPVDMDSIKAIVSDQKSRYFYPELLQRYVALDTTLSELEYRLVYYGFAFQPDYIKNQPDESKLRELAKGESYEEIQQEAAAVLRLNPFSLMANYLMGYAHFKRSPETGAWKKYRYHYYALRKTIARSGNGLRPETAFVVLYVEDEYEMMYDYFKIPKIHRQVCCDMFEVDEGEYYKAKEIHFNISHNLRRQQQLLEGGE